MASEALKGDSTDIAVSGAVGRGKTSFSTALFREWIRKGITNKGFNGLWITAPEILAHIRSTYQRDSKETEREVINYYSKLPLLLIDDLGAEKQSDWSISAFYQILSDRVNWCKHTIITTNMGFIDMNDWEPRIASRVAGMHCIKMTGEDRRLNK